MRRRASRGAQGISPSMLGEGAQRQIAAFLLAERERQRLRDIKATGALGGAIEEEPKRSKYGARRTVVDGFSFASKLEARRYGVLKQRVQLGLIADLELQPRFPLVVEGVLICTYVGDFRYREVATGRRPVEDTKGFRTPEYRIKAKLFSVLYPEIELVEVKSCRA